MEQYVNYSRIIKYFEEFANTSKFVNGFGYGNLIDYGKDIDNVTPIYPLLFVIPISITFNETTTTYQLQIIVGDRLNSDMENSADIISESQMIMRDLLSQIQLGEYRDIMDITIPAVGQPFQERFNDVLAGVSVDLEVTVADFMDICQIENDLKKKIVINGDYSGGHNVLVELYKTGATGTVSTVYSHPETGSSIFNHTEYLEDNATYELYVSDGIKSRIHLDITAGNETLLDVDDTSDYSYPIIDTGINYHISITDG